MSGRLPDLVAAIEGWLSWLVVVRDGEPRLQSVVRGDLWEPRIAMSAICTVGFSEALPRHVPGHQLCRCGIHAARDRGEAEGHLTPPSRRTGIAAIGRVALWGTVVEGDVGWRASFAYPVSLELVTWRRDADVLADLGWVRRSLAEAYGVPVRIARAPVGKGPTPVRATEPARGRGNLFSKADESVYRCGFGRAVQSLESPRPFFRPQDDERTDTPAAN